MGGGGSGGGGGGAGAVVEGEGGRGQWWGDAWDRSTVLAAALPPVLDRLRLKQIVFK